MSINSALCYTQRIVCMSQQCCRELVVAALCLSGHSPRQRERLQRRQPRRKGENVPTMVQKQPLRQRGLNVRFGQSIAAHQPDHRRDEIRERRNPLHDDKTDRAEPPRSSGSRIERCSDQARQGEQCERHRRYINPKQEAVFGHIRGGIFAH